MGKEGGCSAALILGTAPSALCLAEHLLHRLKLKERFGFVFDSRLELLTLFKFIVQQLDRLQDGAGHLAVSLPLTKLPPLSAPPRGPSAPPRVQTLLVWLVSELKRFLL